MLRKNDIPGRKNNGKSAMSRQINEDAAWKRLCLTGTGSLTRDVTVFSEGGGIDRDDEKDCSV